ncbi:MAG: YeeE/YedE family protein [Ignavibacteriales bacterium]|nr:YeeE/YedE family protein [Ignavibacteriales bacterium]
MNERKYMNPYLAGVLLGILLLLTIYITGRGLGASGGVKSFVAGAVKVIVPSHYDNTKFYQQLEAESPGGPFKAWLGLEILGVLIGAFISGAISNRLALKLEKGPRVTNKMRLIAAAIGGFLFGLGALIGRGCTSGAALSGMAVMSLGGILTMFAIFGSAYAVAFFVRKLWIK